MRKRIIRVLVVAGALALPLSTSTTALADTSTPGAPDFGTSVHIFNPGLDQATIQAQLNDIASAQVNNEFGSRRDAILFEPGTYGSSSHPLNFQVGYSPVSLVWGFRRTTSSSTAPSTSSI